eukprot:4898747-Prymnesium_polylepis.2
MPERHNIAPTRHLPLATARKLVECLQLSLLVLEAHCERLPGGEFLDARGDRDLGDATAL